MDADPGCWAQVYSMCVVSHDKWGEVQLISTQQDMGWWMHAFRWVPISRTPPPATPSDSSTSLPTDASKLYSLLPHPRLSLLSESFLLALLDFCLYWSQPWVAEFSYIFWCWTLQPLLLQPYPPKQWDTSWTLSCLRTHYLTCTWTRFHHMPLFNLALMDTLRTVMWSLSGANSCLAPTSTLGLVLPGSPDLHHFTNLSSSCLHPKVTSLAWAPSVSQGSDPYSVCQCFSFHACQ